jgi:hypothetical protein
MSLSTFGSSTFGTLLLSGSSIVSAVGPSSRYLPSSSDPIVQTFQALGQIPIPHEKIDHAPLKDLVARSLQLATDPVDPVEWQLIYEEIARRMMGKEPLLHTPIHPLPPS